MCSRYANVWHTYTYNERLGYNHEYSDFVPLCMLSGEFGSETDAGNDGHTYSYCRENEENQSNTRDSEREGHSVYQQFTNHNFLV